MNGIKMNSLIKKINIFAKKTQKKSIFICNKNENIARLWIYFNIGNGASSAVLSRLFFQRFKDIHPVLSIEQADNAVKYFFDPSFNSVYANRLERIGRFDDANEIKKQISDLEQVKPHIKNVDSVFKVLSSKGYSELAEKWVTYLLKENSSLQNEIGRKYFIYFKDIDAQRSLVLSQNYLFQNPTDEKFAAVYLKRAESIVSESEYLNLINKLNKLYSCSLYSDRLEQLIIKRNINELLISTTSEYALTEILSSEQNEKIRLALTKAIFDKSSDNKLKKICADYLVRNEDKLENTWIRKLSDYHLSRGSITKALNLVDEKKNEQLMKKFSSISSFYKLFTDGYKYMPVDNDPIHIPRSNKALYLLHNRLPYNSGGYATRSHGLLTSIKQWWDISGVSRLGYPQDRSGFDDVAYTEFHDIDGVRYHCLQADNNAFGQIPIINYIDEYSEALYQLSLNEKPAIIHGASNYMNGLAANNVAKRLGIKSVYEVRGLWEITRISRDPDWKDTEYYNMMSQLEAQAAKDADAVFTLTNALKNELINRGVAAEKIHLLPNGVDSSRFIPKIRNNKLALNLGIEDKVVIGFLGSVVQYEGVEYIIQAASILKKQGLNNFVVLIVGDGAVLDNVKAITSELHMDEHVKFTGRVPHDEIEDYYSIVDICPLPRKGLPVCEMVSPLKPFEAMAMGKVVVSSDVAALAEIIDDGVTGLLHKKDDPEDLANKIRLLIEDHDLRDRLGKSAREWVVAERDWKVIAKRVDTVYRNLLGQ
ncbi:glycosyltransferase family 4 protein [Aeromonas salmonicida]|uniref:glycosyltransferase family 4 protein n=1 Tax=Aeromonas salmonicida TaxID=645 RepID=UPI003D1D7B88